MIGYGAFYKQASWTKDVAEGEKRKELNALSKEDLINYAIKLEGENERLKRYKEDNSYSNKIEKQQLQEQIKLQQENIKVLLAEIQRLKYGTDEEEYE